MEMSKFANIKYTTKVNERYKHCIFENCTFNSLIKCSFEYCEFRFCKFDRSAIIDTWFDFCNFEYSWLIKGAVKGIKFNHSVLPRRGQPVYISGEIGQEIYGFDLKVCRKDLYKLLDTVEPKDIDKLIDAIQNGRINGNRYWGECTCVIGTLYKSNKDGVRDFIRADKMSSLESLVLSVQKGDKPETNKILSWLLETINTIMLNRKVGDNV